jgi:type I restriction enzyme S subunit
MIDADIAPLAENADVIRGVTFSKRDAVADVRAGYVPVLRAGNIQDTLILDDDLVFVPRSMVSERQRLKTGDIVMCTSSGSVEVVGKTAFVHNDWEGSFGAFCAVVRPKKGKCIPRYLFHYLQSPAFRTWTRNSSGIGIKNIRKSELDAVEIPFPVMDEQRRIAAILDKADTIRRKRQQSLNFADNLLRSAFMELFGDPVSNPKKLPLSPIKEMGRVVTGNTPPRKDLENYGPGIEWIKSDNVGTPHHFLTEAAETLTERGQSIGRTVPAGATLVTCIAGSPSSIGNAALADREVAFNQQINAVVPNPDVDPFFLYCHFLVGKKLVQNASTNSMKGMVSKGKFQEIEFIDPSPDEQRNFGLIFKKILGATEKLQSSCADGEALFGSLSQRAFSGDL